MCLPGGTGRRGKSGLSGGLGGGGPAHRSVPSRGPLISPIVSHWPLASLPCPCCNVLWDITNIVCVWNSATMFVMSYRTLHCSVHPPFASLPRRSPREVVGPSASSSRRWSYRAGARLKCSWKSRPGAWRLLQHCHLPARGLLSLISLLSAFSLTGINRNQPINDEKKAVFKTARYDGGLTTVSMQVGEYKLSPSII